MHYKNEKIFSYSGLVLVQENSLSVEIINSITGEEENENEFLKFKLSKNIIEEIYPKFSINCALNPLTTIFNENLETINKKYKFLIKIICKELASLALKLNIKIFSEEILFQKIIDATKKFPKHYSSMHFDIFNGDKTEIDQINGAAVLLAKSFSLNMPINEKLVFIIKKMELLRAHYLKNSDFLHNQALILNKFKNDLLIYS